MHHVCIITISSLFSLLSTHCIHLIAACDKDTCILTWSLLNDSCTNWAPAKTPVPSRRVISKVHSIIPERRTTNCGGVAWEPGNPGSIIRAKQATVGHLCHPVLAVLSYCLANMTTWYESSIKLCKDSRRFSGLKGEKLRPGNAHHISWLYVLVFCQFMFMTRLRNIAEEANTRSAPLC